MTADICSHLTEEHLTDRRHLLTPHRGTSHRCLQFLLHGTGVFTQQRFLTFPPVFATLLLRREIVHSQKTILEFEPIHRPQPEEPWTTALVGFSPFSPALISCRVCTALCQVTEIFDFNYNCFNDNVDYDTQTSQTCDDGNFLNDCQDLAVSGIECSFIRNIYMHVYIYVHIDIYTQFAAV